MDDIWEDFDALLWLRGKQRQYAGYDPDSQDGIRHQYFKAAADELERLRSPQQPGPPEATAWLLECLDREAEKTADKIHEQHGEPWSTDSTLVGQAAECIRSLLLKLDRSRAALRQCIDAFERYERGHTHWEGCEKHHPSCRAIRAAEEALSDE